MLYDVSTIVLELDGSSFAAFAVTKDNNRTELPLYGYDQDDDDERELDVAALMEGRNTEEYREEIAKRFNEEAKKFFSGEESFLRTDKRF